MRFLRRFSKNARLLAAGLLALAAFALFLGALRLKRFVDEDPRLCVACHKASPEFALWMGGSHRKVACQRCHHPTSEQGFAMLRTMMVGGKPTGRHTEIQVGSCAACHFSHDPRWPQVGGSRGHKLHVEQHQVSCVRCHAANMHGFAPIAERCRDCHPGHAVGVAGMQGLHCFACHQFLTDEPGLRPTRRDCLGCHAAQGVRASMSTASSKMDCAGCHKPHRPSGQSLAACGECHAPATMGTAGLHGRRGHAACLECHRPHGWNAGGAACVRCHGGAPGHAAGKPCLACHAFKGAIVPPRPAGR